MPTPSSEPRDAISRGGGSTAREGIFREQVGDTLYLAWNNRQLPKDKSALVLVVLFWVVWAPATVVATIKLINVNGPVPTLDRMIVLVVCWAVTFWIPYSLMERFCTEWLVISPTSISHGFRGFLPSRAKTFSLESIRELSVGRYYCVETNEQENGITLSIHLQRRRFRQSRRMLARWLVPEIKEEIYHLIAEFVEQRGINLKLERYE